jgi:Kef-type K+ transport system membrane component KefB
MNLTIKQALLLTAIPIALGMATGALLFLGTNNADFAAVGSGVASFAFTVIIANRIGLGKTSP